MKKSRLQLSRMIILSFFLILITALAVLHQVFGGGPAGYPAIDALCPFGGLEVMYKFAASHEFLKRTAFSNFILLGGTIALVLVAGRFFCGWICMIGFLQEMFAKLGMKLCKRRFLIPASVDRYLRFVKYIVLFAVIALTWRAADLIIRPYDPFVVWSHIPSGLEVFEEFLPGVIIFILSLFFSMFFDRVFCKYLCPLGGFLGILHRVGLYKIKRDDSTCIHCGKCDNVCPVNLDISESERVISSECINCMQCVTICPTGKNTLKPVIFRYFVRSWKIAVIGMVIYIGIIAASKAAGVWNTSEGGESGALSSAGEKNPDNIRGYMKMAEIAENFSISVSDLYAKLGITRDDISYHSTMKEAVHKSEKLAKQIKEDDIRNAVKELTAAQGRSVHAEKESVKADAGSKPDPASIKGTMTLREISVKYQVTLDALYGRLNLSKDLVSSDVPSKEIKNILQKKGRNFEVEEIRTAVKELRK